MFRSFCFVCEIYSGEPFSYSNKKHLKNVGPIRHNEPPHAHSADVASGTVARRLRIDVYDDDDNDNAWQRGPLWPHGMGPTRERPQVLIHKKRTSESGYYKALHGQLPQYPAEDCQLLTDIGRRSLRSADVLTCATKRTCTRLGDRSSSVAGPSLWNSLPVALRDRDISLEQFKRLLKTLWFV